MIFNLTGTDHMKKLFVIMVIAGLSLQLGGQSFSLLNPGITGCYIGSVQWGDYDNNGLMDFLISGGGNPSVQYVRVARNNGNNTFTSFNVSTEAMRISSARWADYDNDGDLDICYSGLVTVTYQNPNYIYTCAARIMRNNGNNTFTDIQAGITPLYYPTIRWADFDNDGDLDLIITGNNVNEEAEGAIFINKGGDKFEKLTTYIPFVSGELGDLEVEDLNFDQQNDIAMFGRDINGNNINSFLINKGNLSFDNISASILSDSRQIGLSDLNSDGLYDIEFQGGRTAYAFNTGNLTFPTLTDLQYGYNEGDFSSEDYNNDGKNDLFETGYYIISSTYYYSSHLYINQTNNTFLKSTEAFTGVGYSSLSWGDYDGDKDLDLLVAGTDGSQYLCQIFINNMPNSNQAPSVPANLKKKFDGHNVYLSWARSSDNSTPVRSLTYNVFIGTTKTNFSIVNPMANLATGKLKLPQRGNAGMDTAFLIKNLSPGKYYWSVQAIDNSLTTSAFATVDSITILPDFTETVIETGGPIDFGNSALLDYDRDGDLDILVAGDTRISYVDYTRMKIYENSGSGFAANDINLTKITRALLTISDINNDNWPDFMISNFYNSDSILIRNNLKNKSFGQNLIIGSPATCVAGFSDVNKDGKQDIVYDNAVYRNNFPQFIKKTATIDLNNNFTVADLNNDMREDIISGSYYFLNSGNSFSANMLSYQNASGASAAAGDLDNDGLSEFDVSWFDNNGSENFLYSNSGNNVFSLISHNLRKASSGGVAIGDYDNDGFNDILVNGYSGNGITKLYRNTGNMSFEEVVFPFLGLNFCPALLGDIDNDNDLDIILIGSNTMTGGKSLTIYYNNNANKNIPPTAPSGLTSQPYGYGIKLGWTAATDDHTPVKTLTYNVRIGTASKRTNIVSPLADTVSGKRYIVSPGNAYQNTGFILDSLAPGNYYWSVQAIDGAYIGGTWATEKSFTVSVLNTDFIYDTVCIGNATHFTDKTLVSGVVLDSWNWNFGDGTSSTLQNPTHTYTTAGSFTVTLTAGAGANYQSMSHVIIVKPRPTAAFTTNIACLGIATSITNTTVVNGTTITQWNWSFGDTQSSTVQNPLTHTYPNAGTFTTILSATASNGCSSSYSAVVTVGSYPAGGISANAPLTFCMGDSVTLSFPRNSNYTYKWLLNGTPITNGDSSKYTAKLTGSYTVDVVNKTGNCKTTPTAVNITANTSPVAPLITSGGPIQFCQGDSVVLSVTQTAGYSYQWKMNGGAVGTNKNTFTAKNAGTYNVVVSNSNGCSVGSSNSIIVTINSLPVAGAISRSGPVSFCQGQNVLLSVTNNPAYIYQWKKDNSGISGATTSSYTATNAGVYALFITNSSGCTNKTEDVTVSTSPTPSAPFISGSGPVQFCLGDSVILSITQTPGYTYQWKLNDGSVGSNSNQLVAKNAGNYKIVVSNTSSCSAVSSNAIDVIVKSLPAASTINLSGSPEFCQGGSVTLSVPVTAGLSYKWRNENGIISGATTNSYTTTITGNYFIDISNSSGCTVKTSPVNVVVKTIPLKPGITSVNYTQGQCPGENAIRLDVSQVQNGYSYQWYRNGSALPGATSNYLGGIVSQGDYLVEADLNGCKSQSDIFSISFPEALSKPVIYAQGPTVWYLACSNDSASQYRWYYNGSLIQGADKYLYVANKNLGQYYVNIANSKGCFTMSDMITIPTGQTGVENIDPFAGLKIYPNPTRGIFTFEMENQVSGELILKIITPDGREVQNNKFKKSANHFSGQVNITKLPKGSYFITFDLDKKTAVKRIIFE
jgi:PKD repeat protein